MKLKDLKAVNELNSSIEKLRLPCSEVDLHLDNNGTLINFHIDLSEINKKEAAKAVREFQGRLIAIAGKALQDLGVEL